MLKKLFVILMLAILAFAFGGCGKTGDTEVSDQAVNKSAAEYQAEAQQQINKDNMSAELDKLETSIEADANTGK